MSNLASIQMYTDGSCQSNPGGAGGWGAIIIYPDGSIERYAGHETSTTSNRMEVMAAIGGLKNTKINSKIEIFSDSRYLVNSMSRGWKKRKNTDLWDILDAIAKQRIITWTWIKGHNGLFYNEAADKLAKAASHDKHEEYIKLCVNDPVWGTDRVPVYLGPPEMWEYINLDYT